jgi:hypothetical protein
MLEFRNFGLIELIKNRFCIIVRNETHRVPRSDRLAGLHCGAGRVLILFKIVQYWTDNPFATGYFDKWKVWDQPYDAL